MNGYDTDKRLAFSNSKPLHEKESQGWHKEIRRIRFDIQTPLHKALKTARKKK